MAEFLCWWLCFLFNGGGEIFVYGSGSVCVNGGGCVFCLMVVVGFFYLWKWLGFCVNGGGYVFLFNSGDGFFVYGGG